MNTSRTASFASCVAALVVTGSAAVAGAALAAPPASAAAANLVVNGGFEQPALPAGSWGLYGSIPGWQTPAGAPAEIENGAVGVAAEGSQVTEIDSSESTALVQLVPTVPGSAYVLSISFAPRPGTGLAENQVDVNWNGTHLTRLSADGTGKSSLVWQTYRIQVPAGTSASTKLALRDAGPSDGLGMLLDAVSVVSSAGITAPAATSGLPVGLDTADIGSLLSNVSTDQSASSDQVVQAQVTEISATNQKIGDVNGQVTALQSELGTGGDDSALENSIQQLQQQMEALTGTGQQETLQLQSMVTKYNEAIDMASTIAQKFSDTKDEIVANMG